MSALLAIFLFSSGLAGFPEKSFVPSTISNIQNRVKEANDSGAEDVLVELVGKITASNGRILVLDDGTGKVSVTPSKDFGCKRGDRVRLRGHVHAKHYGKVNRSIFAFSADVLGQETPVPPYRASVPECLSSFADLKEVLVEGVATDAFIDELDPNYLFIPIESEGLTVTAVLANPTASDIARAKSFIDAKISLHGICFPFSISPRRQFSRIISIASTDDITLLEPSPQDPFSGNSLMDDPTDIRPAPPKFPHRKTVTGTIVGRWNRLGLFLKADNGTRIRATLAKSSTVPPPGARVVLSGFVRRNAFFLSLANTLVRQDGETQRLESPQEVQAEDILRTPDGQPRIQARLDGHAISIEGIVRSHSQDIDSTPVVFLESGKTTVPVRLYGIPAPSVGSRVRMSGICQILTDDDGSDMIHATGFMLVPRNADDIAVLEPPPWWTPGRLLAVIAILLLALGALAVRIVLNRKLVALRLAERSRLSAELHDTVAQNLTAISFQMSAAESARTVEPEAATKHMGIAARMLKSCRTELRRCIWDLRNDALSEPDFAKAVRETVTPVLGRARLAVRANVRRAALDDLTAQAVLSMLRELTSNAVNHGNASSVRIAGDLTDGTLRLSVTDDGCGFNPASLPAQESGHFGLVGIRERLHRLGGDLEIQSTDRGTRAVISLILGK